MFQVPSHPHSPSFQTAPHHAHRKSIVASATSPAPKSVQLPRRLSRPEYTEVSRSAIIAAAPELANIPPEYIRQSLRPKEAEMQAGLNALSSSRMPSTLPKTHLPSHLSVPLYHKSSSIPPVHPTHALAVCPSRSSGHDSQALIIPVHHLILAAHCARLPTLPPSPFQTRGRDYLDLPVVPISLPSPHAFTLIHKYLYTHSLDDVLKSLIPLPSSFLPSSSTPSLNRETLCTLMTSESTLSSLSHHLAEHALHNLSTLMTHVTHVKDFWQTLVVLGVYDWALWDVVDLAWDVCLGGLVCLDGLNVRKVREFPVLGLFDQKDVNATVSTTLSNSNTPSKSTQAVSGLDDGTLRIWDASTGNSIGHLSKQSGNEDHAMDGTCVRKEIKKEALEGLENWSHSTDAREDVVDEPEQDELLPTPSPPHSPSRTIEDKLKECEDVEVDSEDRRSDFVFSQTSTPHQSVPLVIEVEPQLRVGAAETISFTAEIQEQSDRPDTDVNASPALTTKSPHPSPLLSPAQQTMPLSSPLSSPISSPIEPTITIDVQRSDNGIPAEQRASALSDVVPELVPSTSISPDQSVRDAPPATPPVLFSLSPLSSPVSVNDRDDDVKPIRGSTIQDDPDTTLESKTEPPKEPSPLPEPAAFHLVQRPGITFSLSIMNRAVQKKQDPFDCFRTADSSPTPIGEGPDPPESEHLTIRNTKYSSPLHSPDWILSMHHDWGWLSRSGGDKASLPESRKRDTANFLSHLLAEWAAPAPGAFDNANRFGIHRSSIANAQKVDYNTTINNYYPAPTSNSGPSSSYESHLQQQMILLLQKQLEDERTIRKQNEARHERELSDIRQSLHRLGTRLLPGPEPPPNEAKNEDSYFDIRRAIYLQKLVTQDDRTTFVTEMIAFVTLPLRNPTLAPVAHSPSFQRLPNVDKHQLWTKSHDVAITSSVYPTADTSTTRMGNLSLDSVLRDF
ncbi:hypothetical protein D9758_014915 [Tetrapyrgos nigripes]|uniref:Uncharacterized protein n=1 Tax=Tetrapyrgos nigripes TaxID=182062 RepID=A0A8H5CAL9_9AGAR|nr:hypothetical protein D9758_014915 [Tetrapyrgos nigripes]